MQNALKRFPFAEVCSSVISFVTDATLSSCHRSQLLLSSSSLSLSWGVKLATGDQAGHLCSGVNSEYDHIVCNYLTTEYPFEK